MQYNTSFTCISGFLSSIYSIKPRKNRVITNPSLVTKTLLDNLENPEKNIKSILITGSKGKL